MVKVADVELESCPFCKGEVELWKYSEAIKCRFICKKCKVEVEFPRGLDSKDCIRKWNRRDTWKGITVDGGNDILDTPCAGEEVLSETICMDEGLNQFKTVKYRPTCIHGCTDCIWDPAYIYATYPNWYKKLYGNAKPEDIACENCKTGERYDDEDK